MLTMCSQRGSSAARLEWLAKLLAGEDSILQVLHMHGVSVCSGKQTEMNTVHSSRSITLVYSLHASRPTALTFSSCLAASAM